MTMTEHTSTVTRFLAVAIGLLSATFWSLRVERLFDIWKASPFAVFLGVLVTVALVAIWWRPLAGAAVSVISALTLAAVLNLRLAWPPAVTGYLWWVVPALAVLVVSALNRGSWKAAAMLSAVTALLTFAVWHSYPDRTQLGVPVISSTVVPGAQNLDLDALEALFRHQFVHNYSGEQHQASAFHLSILHGDPSAQLMARFRNHHPQIQKGSEFRAEAGALLFRIEHVETQGERLLVLRGGYWESTCSASGHRYTLRLVSNIWKVTHDQRLWIS